MTDRSVVQIAFYAALIAALGLLPPIAVPFLSGVPITAQTLGVMLAGVMLGPIRGVLAVLLFMFIVALGAPLLSGGRGGLGVFAGPTVGFFVGWPFGVLVTGMIMKATKSWPVWLAAVVAACVGCIGVIYLFGVPGVTLITGVPIDKVLIGTAAFIPGDLIKAAIAGLVAQTVSRGLPGALLSRA
ncbi:MAG: biotin transporter BioY [Rhodobacteraceae bacterium]|nr:biotin transporter BioY [Paracoccaceae bacterium]